VQSGDTLWQISKDHGVSVDELKSWNKLERRSIKPGMKIKIGESK
jgi:LysM repeat protein